MKIHKIRFGFATNSSSTHSIIYWPNCNYKDDKCGSEDFGWENFILTSEYQKKLYLAAQISDNFSRYYDDITMGLIIQHFLGKEVATDWAETLPDVDHQSALSFPAKFGQLCPDYDLLQQFCSLVLDSNVVIIGGNDNAGDNSLYKLQSSPESIIILTDFPKENENLISRYDPKYHYWSIFDSKTGTKIRLTDIFDSVNPAKAYAPEMVDMKITNFCPYNCPYCYQESTATGKHASSWHLRTILRTLSDLKVFEIAYGGGEPTLYPDFFELLKETRNKYYIIPNFSTRRIDWLHDRNATQIVKEYCGGIAFSINDTKSMTEILKLADYAGLRDKISFHFVVGSESEYRFESILETAAKNDVTLTLLGFKQKGKGKEFEYHKYNWAKTINELLDRQNRDTPYRQLVPTLSIDTALAESSQKELKALEIPKLFYETEEGKFSAYIDAVDMKIGPSSYCEDKQMIPFEQKKCGEQNWFDITPNWIQEIFKTF